MDEPNDNLNAQPETQQVQPPHQGDIEPGTPQEPQVAEEGYTFIHPETGEEFSLPADTRIRLKYRSGPLDLPLNEAGNLFQKGYHESTKAEQLAAERKTWEEQATDYQNFLQMRDWLNADQQARTVLEAMATGRMAPANLLQLMQGNHQQPLSQPAPAPTNPADDLSNWFDEPAPQIPAQQAPGQPGVQQPSHAASQPPAWMNPIVQGMNSLIDRVSSMEQEKQQEAQAEQQRQQQERLNRQADETLRAIESSQLPAYCGGNINAAVEMVSGQMALNPGADPQLVIRQLETNLGAGNAAQYQKYLDAKARQSAMQPAQMHPGVPSAPVNVQVPDPRPGDLQSGVTRRHAMNLLRNLGGQR